MNYLHFHCGRTSTAITVYNISLYCDIDANKAEETSAFCFCFSVGGEVSGIGFYGNEPQRSGSQQFIYPEGLIYIRLSVWTLCSLRVCSGPQQTRYFLVVYASTENLTRGRRSEIRLRQPVRDNLESCFWVEAYFMFWSSFGCFCISLGKVRLSCISRNAQRKSHAHPSWLSYL